jgi:mRNA interferase MazF
MKDFTHWGGVKEKLDSLLHRPPFVSEGDMWWASIGENVGSEIGGKSELHSRPVIVLRKLSHGFYFVIPTTSKSKDGSWYFTFTHAEKLTTACLHQARAIDYRRLSSKLGTLDERDFSALRGAFKDLYLP